MKTCELCKREKGTTRHHLIPRTLHKNKWFKKRYTTKYMTEHTAALCKDCHSTVHQFYPEKELGREYNELSKLLESEKIQKYLKWLR